MRFYHGKLFVFLSLMFASLCSVAGESVQVGRYLDHNTIVQDAAQVDPLQEVATLKYSLNTPISTALMLVLKGSGYHLAESSDPLVVNLMRSRVPRPLLEFKNKRIISIVEALAGIGFNVIIKRSARRIIILSQASLDPLRSARNPGTQSKASDTRARPITRATINNSDVLNHYSER